jgi:hypothetical protein
LRLAQYRRCPEEAAVNRYAVIYLLVCGSSVFLGCGGRVDVDSRRPVLQNVGGYISFRNCLKLCIAGDMGDRHPLVPAELALRGFSAKDASGLVFSWNTSVVAASQSMVGPVFVIAIDATGAKDEVIASGELVYYGKVYRVDAHWRKATAWSTATSVDWELVTCGGIPEDPLVFPEIGSQE